MTQKSSNLMNKVAESLNSLSPKQKIFAAYLVKNYMSLAYATLAELGNLAGVSETTVVRFIYAIGYKNLSEFMDALREEIEQTREASAAKLSRYNMEESHYQLPKDAYRAIFKLEMQIMEDTIAKIDPDEYEKAIALLHGAPMLLIVACSPSNCYAEAAGFAFEVLRPGVHKITNLNISEITVINAAPEGAAAIVFSAPRYPAATRRILEILKEKNIRVIGVSDSPLSPIFPYCDIFFQVPEKFVTFIDTNAAYMALIHALAFGVYLKDTSFSKKRVEQYDTLTKRCNYYEQDYLDLIEF